MKDRKEWLLAREIAALKIPGLPQHRQGVVYYLSHRGFVEGHPLVRRFPAPGKGGQRPLKYHTDIVAMFARLGDSSDADLVAELRRRCPAARIVVRVPAQVRPL